jgi:glycosyltransferase involved in cell wall biosynthesis
MQVGFGIPKRRLSIGGGGIFSAHLRGCLIKQGHSVIFDARAPVDVFYDLAATPISTRRYKRIKAPKIFRMDGLGSKVEHRPIYLKKCQIADCTVYQSRFCKRVAEQYIQPKQSVVIYNGTALRPCIDVDIVNPIKVLVYGRFGTTIGRKLGFKHWLDIVNRHRKELGYQMTILGPESYLSRDRFWEILEKHDLFIHTSYGEACSNALLEAMARGCAILCADGCGNAEIINNPDCIVRVKHADTQNDVLPVVEIDRRHAYEQLKRSLQNVETLKRYSLERVQEFEISKKVQEYIDLMLGMCDEL